MAVSRASFLVSFPEFLLAGDTLIDATLAAAELRTSDSFGAQRDRALMLRCADMLANSPSGRDARMVMLQKSGTYSASVYAREFQELSEANAVSASRMGARGC